jgi:hypothetical protein
VRACVSECVRVLVCCKLAMQSHRANDTVAAVGDAGTWITRLVLHLCLRVSTVTFDLLHSDNRRLVQRTRRLLRLSSVEPGTPGPRQHTPQSRSGRTNLCAHARPDASLRDQATHHSRKPATARAAAASVSPLIQGRSAVRRLRVADKASACCRAAAMASGRRRSWSARFRSGRRASSSWDSLRCTGGGGGGGKGEECYAASRKERRYGASKYCKGGFRNKDCCSKGLLGILEVRH